MSQATSRTTGNQNVHYSYLSDQCPPLCCRRWAPPFGACTTAMLEDLKRQGRTTFRMRDGSAVELCLLEHIALSSGPTMQQSDVKDAQPSTTKAENFSTLAQAASPRSVPINWVTSNPGRQGLLTGSFH